MAPTLNSVDLVSRLAERWFAHSERTQSSWPLEGSSFISSFLDDANPLTTPHLGRRSSNTGSTSSHSHVVAAAIISAVLGTALAISSCFAMWRWWKARKDRHHHSGFETPSTIHSPSQMSYSTRPPAHLSVDPFRATYWQPSTFDPNPRWVPQFQPATWQRPISLAYKHEKMGSRSTLSTSNDTIVPPWVRVRKSNLSTSSIPEVQTREPVSNYKWSSKAALPPPTAAYIVGSRAQPSTTIPEVPPSVPASPPIVVSLPVAADEPSRRYTMQTESSSVKRASVAARPSEDTIPPVPPVPATGDVPEAETETGSAEGEEFEIPDFKYTVPKTPRYSSLPKNQTGGPTSGLEVLVENQFPPTPPSIAAQYGHTPHTATTRVMVSPMDSSTGETPLPSAPIQARQVLPRLVKVVGTFKASLADELALTLGETLRLLHVFPDDWCLVQRIHPQNVKQSQPSSMIMETAAVPILCLAEIGSGAPIPRATPTSSAGNSVASASIAGPVAPTKSVVSSDPVVPMPMSSTSGVSGVSGASSTSGASGASSERTDASSGTNTTTKTQLSENSHWSSATTALATLTPNTSPSAISDRSIGEVVKATRALAPVGRVDDRKGNEAGSPIPIPLSGSSIASGASESSGASGQSLVVPPGLSSGGYMPLMPKKLSKVTRPTQHIRTKNSRLGPQSKAAAGMSMKNGTLLAMLDRTRAS